MEAEQIQQVEAEYKRLLEERDATIKWQRSIIEVLIARVNELYTVQQILLAIRNEDELETHWLN